MELCDWVKMSCRELFYELCDLISSLSIITLIFCIGKMTELDLCLIELQRRVYVVKMFRSVVFRFPHGYEVDTLLSVVSKYQNVDVVWFSFVELIMMVIHCFNRPGKLIHFLHLMFDLQN